MSKHLKLSTLYLIIIFCIAELLVFLLLQYQSTLKINNKIELFENRVNNIYDILFQNSKNYADIIFEDIIQSNKAIDIIKNANNNKDNYIVLDGLKNELYNLLNNKYETMKKLGIVQFNFILNDGISFYRFHSPEKYGDDLLAVRESIAFVHKYKIPIYTFEGGKIYSGYRFVYPIFDDNDDFIGIVEISYIAESIIKQFKNNQYQTLFLEYKDSIEYKLFDDVKYHYNNSILSDDFIINKAIVPMEKSIYIANTLKDNINHKKLLNHINSHQSFSLYYKNFKTNQYEVAYFKALKHSITNEFLGYILLISNIYDIEDYINSLYINFLLATLFIVGLISYVYTIKQKQKKLSISIEHEKKLLANIDNNVIYAKSNLKGEIIEISKAFCEISGYTKEELIGQSFKILKHPDMPHKLYESLWKNITSGKSWQQEIKNLAKDGSFYWLKINIHPDFDENGKINSYIAISQNITDKKTIESLYKDLRLQIEEHKAIFDNANSGIAIIDLDGKFVRLNAKFIKHLNLNSKNSIKNIYFSDFLSDGSKEIFHNALLQVKNLNINIKKLTLEYINPQNGISYLESSFNLLPNKNSIVVVANILDNQIILEKNLEFTKALLYAIPLPIFILDKEFILIDCNQAFVEFFDIEKSEINSRKNQKINDALLLDLLPNESNKLFEQNDNKRSNDSLYMHQTKYIDKDGVEKTIELYKTPYKYKDEFNGIIGVIVDISTKEKQTNILQETIKNKISENMQQIKHFEEERLKSIKFQAIGQLAAGITHEINTPLTFVKGNLEMMLYDISRLPKSLAKTNLLELSDSIMVGINKIANIVESMREVSQQSNEKKEITNLYHTILVALTMAHNRAKIISKIYINNQEFTLGMNKNEFIYLSNIQKQRIEQVWIVIINNALDELVKIEPYEKRYIDIQIATEDKYHKILIKDNAGGIQKELLDNIFIPFSSNKKSSGMGIGLNIANKIIKDNNGEILVYNDEFGAVFEIRLPID